ncbi:MAG: copper resistance protein CopC [Actinomycetota bacterium]|nr:copper resistance protein CopC [Actinomycetota bacterium]
MMLAAGTSGMSARRVLLTAVIALGLALGLPTVALAHAGLVSSTPEPGSELASAPGAVILRFSEPLNVRLSEAFGDHA